jgi:hypothetical protein
MSDEVTNPIVDAETIKGYLLQEIAIVIENTWKNAKGESTINFAAKPYLDALHALNGMGDNYGAENSKGIVLYFLANASAYRGEQAKIVKAELKRRTK